jgi:1-acyl-sn-glycerol-3-phosphate acyltransferase
MYPIISHRSSVGLDYHNGSYRTGRRHVFPLWKALPTLGFVRYIFPIVFRAGARAKWGTFDTTEWAKSSLEVLRALENIGITIEITGVDHFRELNGPCVFLSNHMSTFETFVLPVVIASIKPVTFVVKEALVDTPVFKYVMRSRDPVTVGRTNARDDLRAVLEGGTERLNAGISIIIFPQTTRFLDFDPKTFNTIGIKLAKKAGVPVVPIALKTDAWGNGKHFKDFGRMDPSLPVHFAFGKPLWIKDRGTEEHNKVLQFINDKLNEWREQDATPAQ